MMGSSAAEGPSKMALRCLKLAISKETLNIKLSNLKIESKDLFMKSRGPKILQILPMRRLKNSSKQGIDIRNNLKKK